jgi:hypothetical protein
MVWISPDLTSAFSFEDETRELAHDTASTANEAEIRGRPAASMAIGANLIFVVYDMIGCEIQVVLKVTIAFLPG